MRISAMSIDITPRRAVPLGANGLPQTPFESITSSIEANLLVLHEPDGPIAIATFDLLFVGPTITELVTSELAELLPAERIWLSASHTHRAPAVDINKPNLGVPDGLYVNWVVERVVAGIKNLLRDVNGTEARLVVRQGLAHHSMNRRRKGRPRLHRHGIRWGGVSLGPNPNGPTDEAIRRADLIARDGAIVAVMWSYTCHPTSAPDRLSVTSDYVGSVRETIRSSRPIPVLFFQGFAGNTRPPSVAAFRDAPLRRMRLGPHFRDFTPAEHQSWSASLSQAVQAAPEAAVQRPSGPVSVYRKEVATAKFVLQSKVKSAVFQAIDFGNLRLVGINAEPVVEYRACISRRTTGEPEIWPVGYLGDVFGYVPTNMQLTEGGYEATGFCRNFACSQVTPNVEAVMTELLTTTSGLSQTI